MTDEPTRNDRADQDEQPHGPGQRLREQRESLGLTLEQVAQELRILKGVLQALEENRYEVLEAPIFVRGHLRNYARLLDLPVDQIVAAYDATLPAHSTPELRLGRKGGPAMDAQTPAWVAPVAWLVVLTMLVMGGLWWYAGPHRETIAIDQERPTPAVAEETVTQRQSSPRDEGDVEREVAEAAVTETEGASVDELADEPASLIDEGDAGRNDADPEPPVAREAAPETAEETDAVSRQAVAMPAEVDDVETVPAPIPPLEDVDPAERRILLLSLDDDSWLEIHDADDRQLYYGLAVQGEDVRVEGRAPISVFMGNAPAVTIQADGETVDFSARIRRDNTARIRVDAGNQGSPGQD
ncbi:RodZ domain-containing protein [Natronospira bacteriovora]|uniref:DUF4115 domain-containing protein n=1 Tax=Natronospira bacteriovora TaxID=3069753 RepID=A0ABU0W4N0_9GAMM|nr:RodZ domain-containing protein [Natronospira sp. AB-CW4]MDQ2068713.1 DUF4115 domain-containing protein [Natronospira sp. AB-CW4]